MVRDLVAVALVACSLLVHGFVLAEDARDIGVVDIKFLNQGDGTIAVETCVRIKQNGDYGFHLTVEQYRSGNLVAVLRDDDFATTASGCPGVEACPGGASCAGSCLIGNIFIVTATMQDVAFLEARMTAGISACA